MPDNSANLQINLQAGDSVQSVYSQVRALLDDLAARANVTLNMAQGGGGTGSGTGGGPTSSPGASGARARVMNSVTPSATVTAAGPPLGSTATNGTAQQYVRAGMGGGTVPPGVGPIGSATPGAGGGGGGVNPQAMAGAAGGSGYARGFGGFRTYFGLSMGLHTATQAFGTYMNAQTHEELTDMPDRMGQAQGYGSIIGGAIGFGIGALIPGANIFTAGLGATVGSQVGGSLGGYLEAPAVRGLKLQEAALYPAIAAVNYGGTFGSGQLRTSHGTQSVSGGVGGQGVSVPTTSYSYNNPVLPLAKEFARWAGGDTAGNLGVARTVRDKYWGGVEEYALPSDELMKSGTLFADSLMQAGIDPFGFVGTSEITGERDVLDHYDRVQTGSHKERRRRLRSAGYSNSRTTTETDRYTSSGGAGSMSSTGGGRGGDGPSGGDIADRNLSTSPVGAIGYDPDQDRHVVPDNHARVPDDPRQQGYRWQVSNQQRTRSTTQTDQQDAQYEYYDVDVPDFTMKPVYRKEKTSGTVQQRLFEQYAEIADKLYGAAAKEITPMVAKIIASLPSTSNNPLDIAMRFGGFATGRYFEMEGERTGTTPVMTQQQLDSYLAMMGGAGRDLAFASTKARGSADAAYGALNASMSIASMFPGGKDSLEYAKLGEQRRSALIGAFHDQDTLNYDIPMIHLKAQQERLQVSPFMPGNIFKNSLATISTERDYLGRMGDEEARLRATGDLSEDKEKEYATRMEALQTDIAKQSATLQYGILDRLPAMAYGLPKGIGRFSSDSLTALNLGMAGFGFVGSAGALSGRHARAQAEFAGAMGAGDSYNPRSRTQDMNNGNNALNEEAVNELKRIRQALERNMGNGGSMSARPMNNMAPQAGAPAQGASSPFN